MGLPLRLFASVLSSRYIPPCGCRGEDSLRGDHDVRRLKIAVDDLLPVGVVHRRAHPPEDPARRLKIAFSRNYPDAAATVEASIPLVKDDLDVAHAQVPAGMHIAAWRR